MNPSDTDTGPDAGLHDEHLSALYRQLPSALPSATTDRAILEVEDNGPGIPAALRPVVLNRFARGETRGPGTGLGLAIVQEVADLFGAELSLDDARSGQGLTVRISFPLL